MYTPFRDLAYIISAVSCSIGLIAHSVSGEENTKPNILLILADDMGYGDLKAFNSQSKIVTPHLDRLAETGMCFTDAHAGGSTCRPSRYSLLTGRFAARKASLSDKVPTIVEGRETIAGMLRDNGYRTAMVGKWHLGFDRTSNQVGKRGADFDYSKPITGGPVDRGFDSFFGMHASLDIPPYFYIRDRTATAPPSSTIAASTSVGQPEGWNNIQGAFWRSGDVAEDFKHAEVSQRFADEAKSVIRSHTEEQPLFLYLALPSPHTPWLPSKDFSQKSRVGMYGDFVMTVDDIVGQVLTCLEESGIGDSTMVLFSSDNGPVWYSKDVQRFDHRSTGHLRGAKGSVWEGGHRVPFIVRWPGHVEPGSTSERTIAFADVFATLAEVARQPSIDASAAEDSVSFVAALTDPNRKAPPRPPILHGEKVIRHGDWKLINTKGGRGFNADKKRKYRVELYNLANDPSETTNLAQEMPERVESLKAKIRSVLAVSEGSGKSAAGDWKELFNGKNLNGWQANVRPESFTVENGVLKAHGKNGMSHLFFVGEDERDDAYKNFELEVLARSEPNSNSGIFFHTDRELRSGKYLNKGYELQLNSSKKEKRKTGSLYGIVDLDESATDETEWFRAGVRVEGKTIVVFINGRRVLEYTEPDHPERKPSRSKRLLDQKGGAIAIQAHDPNSVFYFKQIRIRELD